MPAVVPGDLLLLLLPAQSPTQEKEAGEFDVLAVIKECHCMLQVLQCWGFYQPVMHAAHVLSAFLSCVLGSTPPLTPVTVCC